MLQCYNKSKHHQQTTKLMPLPIKFSPYQQHPTTKSRKNNTTMSFTPNPLSLSIPDSTFESWLRDSNYLQVLDQRTTELHKLTTTTTQPQEIPSFLSQLISSIITIFSLLTFNPFAKLTVNDFSNQTPAWTLSFFASLDSYSFPSSPSQARLRVHENVKRFARNYATLLLLFFACSLYQLPMALFGLVSCLVVWDGFKVGCDKWGLDKHPLVRQILICVAQCACLVILFTSNVQFAVLCALGVSYAVMILHASFRKLTPGNQPAMQGGHKKAGRR